MRHRRPDDIAKELGTVQQRGRSQSSSCTNHIRPRHALETFCGSVTVPARRAVACVDEMTLLKLAQDARRCERLPPQSLA